MNCPYCKYNCLRVIETRDNSETSTRRRRECEKCHKRFTTYERIEKVLISVIKRDGRVEEFDREKIKRGIMKAVKKRGISETQIDNLINEIELFLSGEKQSVTSKEIGKMVLSKLTQIDKLAALLFAAVYKEFSSLEDIHKELILLEKIERGRKK